MKTIGMLGGLSWESTLEYYRAVNSAVSAALGGLHSARCLISSVDFAEIEPLQQRGDWDSVASILGLEARRLSDLGADFLVVCSNTIHRVADEIESAAGIPLLHIADAAAAELRALGLRRVGLLGTKYTLRSDFYVRRLERAGLETVLPEDGEIDELDRVIFAELCRGVVRAESRELYLAAVKRLAERGAEGILLGCTELGMLIGPEDAEVPVVDSAAAHARAAAALALT